MSLDMLHKTVESQQEEVRAAFSAPILVKKNIIEQLQIVLMPIKLQI